ncbi:hypothetical protein QBC43DRAFT_338095 [Cladorrhinum sp. PSN259]|nr:hypothetical protein QBC43DRAFT_338095 [Cladorrhinum sp. PSN259]
MLCFTYNCIFILMKRVPLDVAQTSVKAPECLLPQAEQEESMNADFDPSMQCSGQQPFLALIDSLGSELAQQPQCRTIGHSHILAPDHDWASTTTCPLATSRCDIFCHYYESTTALVAGCWFFIVEVKMRNARRGSCIMISWNKENCSFDATHTTGHTNTESTSDTTSAPKLDRWRFTDTSRLVNMGLRETDKPGGLVVALVIPRVATTIIFGH